MNMDRSSSTSQSSALVHGDLLIVIGEIHHSQRIGEWKTGISRRDLAIHSRCPKLPGNAGGTGVLLEKLIANVEEQARHTIDTHSMAIGQSGDGLAITPTEVVNAVHRFTDTAPILFMKSNGKQLNANKCYKAKIDEQTETP